jgi:N-acetylglucosamine repressor
MTPLETRPIGGLFVHRLPDTPAGRVLGKKEWRRSLILDAVRRSGPISRVDVARLLGLNMQTVARVIDALVSEGLLVEQPSIRNIIGRPPTPVVLNDNACCVLGIDIGPYVTTSLFMNLAGEVLTRREVPTADVQGADRLVAHLESFASQVSRETHPPLSGIGVAMTTYTSFEPGPTGPILSPEATGIRQGLEKLFHVPVIVQDDSLMLALGELWFGKEKNLKTFAAVNISDGLGVGLIIDRHVYNGSRGYVGDLGHLQLGEPGPVCVCGCDRCLDKVASGSGLCRMAEEAGLLFEGHPPNADELAGMARNGHAKARAIFDRFGEGLALGIGTILTLLGPEAVIVGGRFSSYSDLFMESLQRELPKRTVRGYLSSAQIIVSDLHESAVSLGTGACVLNQIFGFSAVSAERII